jgi:hypothetical protein
MKTVTAILAALVLLRSMNALAESHRHDDAELALPMSDYDVEAMVDVDVRTRMPDVAPNSWGFSGLHGTIIGTGKEQGIYVCGEVGVVVVPSVNINPETRRTRFVAKIIAADSSDSRQVSGPESVQLTLGDQASESVFNKLWMQCWKSL